MSAQKRFLLASLLGALPAIAHAQDAPAALRGNSIVVTWVEDKNQRAEGAGEFRQERLYFSMSFYINAESQMSTQFSNVVRGVSSPVSRTSAQNATFQGRSLAVTQGMTVGARRFEIHFNNNYNACNAQVRYGKEPGTNVLVGRTVEGRQLEIRSLKIAETKCSVQNGNVLGH